MSAVEHIIAAVAAGLGAVLGLAIMLVRRSSRRARKAAQPPPAARLPDAVVATAIADQVEHERTHPHGYDHHRRVQAVAGRIRRLLHARGMVAPDEIEKLIGAEVGARWR